METETPRASPRVTPKGRVKEQTHTLDASVSRKRANIRRIGAVAWCYPHSSSLGVQEDIKGSSRETNGRTKCQFNLGVIKVRTLRLLAHRRFLHMPCAYAPGATWTYLASAAAHCQHYRNQN